MADKETPTIEASENGPFIVKGLASLQNARGESVPCDSEVWLCRCGGSSNKPFCDDTHLTNDFRSERVSKKPLDQEHTYEGSGIDVHDKRRICSHSGHCLAAAPKVFDADARPWIQPDNDTPERTAAAVRSCPSAALSYTLNGVREDDFRDEPFLKVVKNGPYYTGGGMVPLADSIAPPNPARFALCRCGYSSTKPFCDGNHRDVDFKSDGLWEGNP